MPISKGKSKVSLSGAVISAPAEAVKVEEPEPKPKRVLRAYVRYVPPNQAFGERVITEADWSTLGIQAPDRTWNALNGMQIPEEDFSDAELDYLETDGGFEIVDA